MRRRLFGIKPHYAEIFTDLKLNGTYKQILAASELFRHPNNPFHSIVYGSGFPKSYTDLSYPPFLNFVSSVDSELKWSSIPIIQYTKELSRFVELSFSFMKSFLSANYTDAEDTLNTIVHQFGVSLWTMDKSFLLAEATSGLEANKRFLTELVKEDSAVDGLCKFMASYMSMRAESKLSPENYRLKLHRAVNFGSEYAVLCNYLLYRLDSLDVDLASIAAHVLYLDASSSIIDRYLTFIAVCQACVAKGGELPRIACEHVKHIGGKIKDIRLQALLHICEPSTIPNWDTTSAEVLQVLDQYTEGEYEASLRASGDLLQSNPTLYEMYYIYLHSQEYLGKPFRQLFPPSSLAGTILERMNSVITRDDGRRASIDAILKISMLLWREPLAYGLYHFYVDEVHATRDTYNLTLALLNCTHVNPRFAYAFDDPARASAFIDQLQTRAATSSTLALLNKLCRACDDHSDTTLPSSIPESRRIIYRAAIHEKTKRPELAIAELRPLWRNIEQGAMPGVRLLNDRVIGALFRCYIRTGAVGECVDMVVQAFLRNPVSIRKLPLSELIAAIEKDRAVDVMRKVSYPILYALVYSKARQVYVAYDNFLGSLSVTRPTQLIKLASNIDSEQLNYFLQKVCTIDVLACSYHFAGTTDLEDERIRICQYLSEHDPKNLRAYSDEITSITSKSIIRKGMRQIEGSRIYVDEQGIRTAGQAVLEESFARYRELTSLNGIDTLRGLHLDALHLLLNKLMANTDRGTAADRPHVMIVTSPPFGLFKELFLDVRDRFISSGEHGLDAYLSIRIRHGVLQNQVRSPFEAQHLISERDTRTGEYLDNAYWKNRLGNVDSEACNAIQGTLAVLSRTVDEIAQTLNKEMVQVKTERKNPNALFDYTFDDLTLLELFSTEFTDITDFEPFLDRVFQVLWRRTDENLAKVRQVISGSIKDKMSEALTRLERHIRSTLEPQHSHEILRNIAVCQTSLQYELDKIAQWFRISGSSLVSKFSIPELLNICVTSIKNVYPHKHFEPFVRCSGAMILDGKYFPHFSDIVRTLLDNILTHSGRPPELMGIEILASCEADRMEISLSNNISENVRRSDPVRALNAAHKNLKSSDITKVIAREGGSGLLKVRKIMSIDLHRITPALVFSYSEDGKFVVRLGMELEGLCYEGASD